MKIVKQDAQKRKNETRVSESIVIDQARLDQAMLAAMAILRKHGVEPKGVRGAK